MVDGAALISSLTWSLMAAGLWKDERGVNLLDSGAPFYDSYQCSDGRWIAVGALEPHFFAILKERTGIRCGQRDPGLRGELTALFLQNPRDHWVELLEGSDACVAPILSLSEAPNHPHNVARSTFVEAGGVTQPAPAPRFSNTPATPPRMPKDDQ